MKTRKIGLANYLAYGAGDFLGAGTTALTAAWLLYFYTTFCGLTPIEATLIFAAARVLDAVVSPLMGFLTDNFGTTWLGKRFGRRKFFILLGIPCVFSYSAMWVGEMGFWYYLVTYLLFDMVYTMILVPYETLVPEMTDDFKQKTKFSGARISMAQMSAILASFLPGILLTWLGKDNASSFFYASLVFSVLCAVMLTFVWCFTWERPREAWSEAALRAEESLLRAPRMKSQPHKEATRANFCGRWEFRHRFCMGWGINPIYHEKNHPHCCRRTSLRYGGDRHRPEENPVSQGRASRSPRKTAGRTAC